MAIDVEGRLAFIVEEKRKVVLPAEKKFENCFILRLVIALMQIAIIVMSSP